MTKQAKRESRLYVCWFAQEGYNESLCRIMEDVGTDSFPDSFQVSASEAGGSKRQKLLAQRPHELTAVGSADDFDSGKPMESQRVLPYCPTTTAGPDDEDLFHKTASGVSLQTPSKPRPTSLPSPIFPRDRATRFGQTDAGSDTDSVVANSPATTPASARQSWAGGHLGLRYAGSPLQALSLNAMVEDPVGDSMVIDSDGDGMELEQVFRRLRRVEQRDS